MSCQFGSFPPSDCSGGGRGWSDPQTAGGIPDWDEIQTSLKASREARGGAGEAAATSGGVVIQGDLVVNSLKADAATMMNTTRRTLRNLGTQAVI